MKCRDLSAIVFIAISLTVDANAAKQKPRVLNSSGPWTLDYADERCSLVRSFGDGSEAVTLQIDSYGSRTSVRFVLAGKPIPSVDKPFGTMSYRFDSNANQQPDTLAIFGTAGKLPAASFGGSFVPDDSSKKYDTYSVAEIVKRQANPIKTPADLGADIRSMTVDFDGRNPIELRLEAMAAPLRALRTCVDDLYRSWGLNAATQEALTRRPAPKIPTVQKLQGRFPSTALSNGLSAFVPVRVMVDETGTATSCIVQIAKVDDEFKQTVCSSLARQFEPALDEAGQPVASVYQTSVIFVNGR